MIRISLNMLVVSYIDSALLVKQTKTVAVGSGLLFHILVTLVCRDIWHVKWPIFIYLWMFTVCWYLRCKCPSIKMWSSCTDVFSYLLIFFYISYCIWSWSICVHTIKFVVKDFKGWKWYCMPDFFLVYFMLFCSVKCSTSWNREFKKFHIYCCCFFCICW